AEGYRQSYRDDSAFADEPTRACLTRQWLKFGSVIFNAQFFPQFRRFIRAYLLLAIRVADEC
ncbi:hypothetical protein NZA98_03055, partial [Escherichia coli]|nr:hypothetical protein [Escherichia coli]